MKSVFEYKEHDKYISIDMETAEYLKNVRKHIEERIRENVKQGIEVSESDYLDQALSYTKTLYKSVTEKRTSKMMYFWRSSDLEDVMAIWNSIRPELEKCIPKAIMNYRSRRMVSEINAVSAEAMVSAAMKEAGLKHLFEAQLYRAKVRVQITEKSKIVIYLNYKKINDELPKAIESLKRLVAILDEMGAGTSIQKIMWYENF